MCKRGITLAEVVVAIGIIAVAGLAVLAVFSRLVASQSQSGHQTIARLLAQQILEEASVAGPPNWSMTDIALPSSRSFQLQSSPQPVVFNYLITPTVVRPAAPTDPMGTVYQLKIDVWWWDSAAGRSRTEQGRTWFTAYRLVYVEN